MDLASLHRKVWGSIIAYSYTHGGNAPTRREIVKFLNLSGPSRAQKIIKDLISAGALEVIDNKLCVVGAKWIPPSRINLHQEHKSDVVPEGTGLS